MKIENKINNVPINLNEMISENCFGLDEKKKRDTIIFLVLRVLIIIYIYINDIYNLLSIKGANYHLYDFTRRYLGEFQIEWSYI
jgi:hypothetical protein